MRYENHSFSDYGYHVMQYFIEKDSVISTIYQQDSSGNILVIDSHDIFSTEFSYKRYCQMQNELMTQCKKVYRFIENDTDIMKFLKGTLEEGNDYALGKTYNREDNSIDPTPIEAGFEAIFQETYGREALNYLQREYSFITYEGKTNYIDYVLFKKDGSWVAIEENGISYHHPFIIGKEKYQQILKKQNSVIENDGVVFRWDTESIANHEKIADELKEFLGNLSDYLFQYRMKSSRGFQLYEHQGNYLNDLKKARDAQKNAALVVLPTGTGKTVLALEDLLEFSKRKKFTHALILVPSIDLVEQWKKEIRTYDFHESKIEVMTYAAISRRYFNEDPSKYDYILVDEAHHAVAPVLRKVISHYQPEFLLGLTATDKRLDEEKLEVIFNEYEEKIDLKEAIRKGLLCQIRSFRLETNIDLSQVRFNGKDYVNADLERSIRVASRNELIAEVLDEYFNKKLSGKSGIVFCVNVNHAKEMANLLKSKGISAESVDGKDKNRFQKIRNYMNKEIQFLCTCSLLNEGWDAPHTSVIVMARPTMSKVLYTQQLGRGTRNHQGKEALYVIDVVDTYGAKGQLSNAPWSVHSLLEIKEYQKFKDLIDTGKATPSQELEILGTTYEQIIKLQPYDLFTFEKAYADYLSAEQLARELFVSTDTLMNWYRKKEIEADLQLPMGSRKLLFFNPRRIQEIRKQKGLKEHNENTIIEDFWDFIEERNYTFGYKIIFVLSFLKTADNTGDADIHELKDEYRKRYLQRFREEKKVEKEKSPYNNKEYLIDDKLLLTSILENPFEKFERKKFLYYSKDLSKISMHHKIWNDLLMNKGVEKLVKQMNEDYHTYFKEL